MMGSQPLAGESEMVYSSTLQEKALKELCTSVRVQVCIFAEYLSVTVKEQTIIKKKQDCPKA